MGRFTVIIDKDGSAGVYDSETRRFISSEDIQRLKAAQDDSYEEWVGGDGVTHLTVNGQHVSFKGGTPQIINGKPVKRR